MSKQVCDTCQQLFSGPMCPACEASEIDDLESRLAKQAEVIALLIAALEDCKAAMTYAHEDRCDQYYLNVLNSINEALAKAEEMLK